MIRQCSIGFKNIIKIIYLFRVMPRQVSEIEIEIRTREGRLVPFQYGTTLVVLVFKKTLLF